MADTHLLSDDGTLDTVLVCEECGQESRYNFDPETEEEDERKAEQAYAEFVQWAIKDADGDHECPELVGAS